MESIEETVDLPVAIEPVSPIISILHEWVIWGGYKGESDEVKWKCGENPIVPRPRRLFLERKEEK